MPPTKVLWGIHLTQVALRENRMGLGTGGRLLFRTTAAAEMHPHSTGNQFNNQYKSGLYMTKKRCENFPLWLFEWPFKFLWQLHVNAYLRTANNCFKKQLCYELIKKQITNCSQTTVSLSLTLNSTIRLTLTSLVSSPSRTHKANANNPMGHSS